METLQVLKSCSQNVEAMLGGMCWAHEPSPLSHSVFFSLLITGMFLQDLSSALTTLTSNLDCSLLLTQTVTQTLVLTIYILHHLEVNWWWEFIFFSLPFWCLSWSGSRLCFHDLDDGNGCMFMKNADDIKQWKAAMLSGLLAGLERLGTVLGTRRYDSRQQESSCAEVGITMCIDTECQYLDASPGSCPQKGMEGW